MRAPGRGPQRSVLVIGAGNTGSQLIPMLGSVAGLVDRVVVCDPDRYEAANLAGQAIGPRDVGRAKARVQARNLRRRNPALSVVAAVEPVESLPSGYFHGAVVVSCVDGRAARQVINAKSMIAGATLVDCAADAASATARVRVCAAAAGPCLECAWSEQDYALLPRTAPCQAVRPEVPPGGASAELGALAASLAMAEVRKVLEGRTAATLMGAQAFVETHAYQSLVARYDVNPRCRVAHGPWPIEVIEAGAGELLLAAALALPRGQRGPRAPELRVHGQTFVRRLRCPVCGWVGRSMLRPVWRAPAGARRCPCCARPTQASAVDTVAALGAATLAARQLERPLASFGIRDRDIVSIAAGGDADPVHYQLGGATDV